MPIESIEKLLASIDAPPEIKAEYADRHFELQRELEAELLRLHKEYAEKTKRLFDEYFNKATGLPLQDGTE